MKLAKTFAEIDSSEQEPAETRIKSYTPIGSVGSTGHVAVSAYEVVVPAKQVLFYSVRFEVSSGEEYASDGIASVPVEDAAKLVSSLEQLANAKITTDRFAFTEIETIVGDLKVTVFNNERGRMLVAVDADGTSCHLTSQKELLDLVKLVNLAIEHLAKNTLEH